MNRDDCGAFGRCIIGGTRLARAETETITVHVSGGFYGEGNIKAFITPFEKESGIRVNSVKSEVPPALFELAAKTCSLDIDAFLTTEANGTLFAREGYIAPIDYSIYDKKGLAGLSPAARKPWGVETSKLGSSSRSVRRFIRRAHHGRQTGKILGVREVSRGAGIAEWPMGTEGPWEEALGRRRSDGQALPARH